MGFRESKHIIQILPPKQLDFALPASIFLLRSILDLGIHSILGSACVPEMLSELRFPYSEDIKRSYFDSLHFAHPRTISVFLLTICTKSDFTVILSVSPCSIYRLWRMILQPTGVCLCYRISPTALPPMTLIFSLSPSSFVARS